MVGLLEHLGKTVVSDDRNCFVSPRLRAGPRCSHQRLGASRPASRRWRRSEDDYVLPAQDVEALRSSFHSGETEAQRLRRESAAGGSAPA